LQFVAVGLLPPAAQVIVKELLDNLIIKHQTRRRDSARTVAVHLRKVMLTR